MPKKKEPSFEEALENLEEIVKTMETGDVTLAELMDHYAKGIELSQKCLTALSRAEKAMDIMVKDESSGIQELELKIEGD